MSSTNVVICRQFFEPLRFQVNRQFQQCYQFQRVGSVLSELTWHINDTSSLGCAGYLLHIVANTGDYPVFVPVQLLESIGH